MEDFEKTEKVITLKELIEFYSNCKDDMSDCPQTLCFLKQYYAETNNEKNYKVKDYVKLANLMQCKFGEQLAGDPDPDDLLIYLYLNLKEEKEEYKFRDGISAKVNIFNPFVVANDEKKQLVSEKWHLLISVLAYWDIANNQDVTSKLMKAIKSSTYKAEGLDYDSNLFQIDQSETNWYFSKKFYISYFGLKLWMAEAAGINIEDTIKRLKGKENKELRQIINSNIQFNSILEKIWNNKFIKGLSK